MLAQVSPSGRREVDRNSEVASRIEGNDLNHEIGRLENDPRLGNGVRGQLLGECRQPELRHIGLSAPGKAFDLNADMEITGTVGSVVLRIVEQKVGHAPLLPTVAAIAYPGETAYI